MRSVAQEHIKPHHPELAEKLEKKFEDVWLLSKNPEKNTDNENEENSALLSIKSSSIISSPSSSSPTISTDSSSEILLPEIYYPSTKVSSKVPIVSP